MCRLSLCFVDRRPIITLAIRQQTEMWENTADLVGADHVLTVLADLFSLLFGLDQLGRCLPQFFFSFLCKHSREQEIILSLINSQILHCAKQYKIIWCFCFGMILDYLDNKCFFSPVYVFACRLFKMLIPLFHKNSEVDDADHYCYFHSISFHFSPEPNLVMR